MIYHGPAFLIGNRGRANGLSQDEAAFPSDTEVEARYLQHDEQIA